MVGANALSHSIRAAQQASAAKLHKAEQAVDGITRDRQAHLTEFRMQERVAKQERQVLQDRLTTLAADSEARGAVAAAAVTRRPVSARSRRAPQAVPSPTVPPLAPVAVARSPAPGLVNGQAFIDIAQGHPRDAHPAILTLFAMGGEGAVPLDDFLRACAEQPEGRRQRS